MDVDPASCFSWLTRLSKMLGHQDPEQGLVGVLISHGSIIGNELLSFASDLRWIWGERALPEEKTLTGLQPSIEVLFVQKSLSLPSDQRRTKINLLRALVPVLQRTENCNSLNNLILINYSRFSFLVITEETPKCHVARRAHGPFDPYGPLDPWSL